MIPRLLPDFLSWIAKWIFHSAILCVFVFASGLALASSPQQSVTGRVTSGGDQAGIPGVNVIIKGTTTGTTTDADGAYSIPVSSGDAVLVFTFVGYVTQEIPVGSRAQIDVVLDPDVTALEEVVVVGYGTMKKSDITGTVSSVTTKKTEDIPNTNVLQSLQGRVAGLSVVTPDRPGESPEIDIRGLNSLSASNAPLIVVDGIIYNGSINDFNVNDIEKIDILKDASAAAVYGSRSSNGVILITSKFGKTTKPTFNFNSYYGVSTPVSLIPLLDGPGYIQKVLDYRSAIGLEADPNKVEDYLLDTEAENYRNGKTVDWYDKIIKTGITQNYNLNISGKSDRTSYYLSGTYFSQSGIVENDLFDRLTFKGNFKNDITDWYSISLMTAFSSLDYSGIESNLFFGYSPYGSYWEDEAKGIYKEFPTEDFYQQHPMWNTFIDNEDIRTTTLATISSQMEIPFIDGLRWTLNYSANLRSRKANTFRDNTILSGGGKTSNGVARKEIYANHDWTLDNILSYQKVLNNVHAFDVTLLYSRESQKYEETIAESNDFLNQALGFNNIGLGKVQRNGSDYQDQNSVATMGRLNYVYDNRYALTATVRRDGFSAFSKNHKYATFPSLALAWTVTNESFMENLGWLDMMKIRLSYGENGNQALGRYQTLARIADAQYVFGDGGGTTPTVYVESISNDNLGWETTKVKNLGVDFAVINGRLNGSIDMYSSNTFDILLRRNIPATTGFSTVWTNIGKVHNSGVEVTLNSLNFERNELAWETGFVFTLNRNRIDELLGEDLDGDGREDDNLANSWFIGQPLGVIYGYKTNGIYQIGDDIPTGFKPGDFRLVDADNDGEITPEDRMILGSELPNFSFSISNTVTYKNFSLYVLLNSIQGGGKDNYYVGNNMAMHNVNNTFSTWTERFNTHDVPYWTPDRPSNAYPRVNYIPTRSHPFLEDRSFVRLQDISLAYSFNASLLDKLGLLGLRAYVSGKNLYTWTKWTGYDPENRTSIGSFPMLRTYTVGIDLRF